MSRSIRSRRWWRNAVIYQIYPRSWMDSNRDGIGDIPGMISRLDYLSWLGVDAIWLNPTTPSPNADWGYDVSDYRTVHPELGSMADIERLIKEADQRGIKVILDLVPNHTSDQHPWFEDARSSRTSCHRDWYVWHDPAADGGPPNNWVRALGQGPAWTLDETTGQYYLHSFLPAQPDLNWWNEAVRAAFDEILKFWFDRGVAGFRIDVVHALIHDPQLRANPPTTPEDHPQVTRIGQRQIYNMNRPEVHEIIRRWRRLCNTYQEPRVLIGETYLLELPEVAKYYGECGDELHLAFNFPFIFADFEASRLAAIVRETHGLLPQDATACWTGSNHDVGRLMTRWCGNDERRSRCALMMLLTLPGAVFLYYGDEIAMPDVAVPRDRLRDPAGIIEWPQPGRDRCRTPIQWSSAPGAGFTHRGIEPWLPLGDYESCNVEAQQADEHSHLAFTRELIHLRRQHQDLLSGDYSELVVDETLWAYRRGEHAEVWLNLGNDTRQVRTSSKRVLLSTHGREGILNSRVIELAPWEGIILLAYDQMR
jgi:alpha-glucosidase